MRETRPSGSEGGARFIPCPYPYHGRRDARRYGCGSGRSGAANFCGYLRLFVLVLEIFLFRRSAKWPDWAVLFKGSMAWRNLTP